MLIKSAADEIASHGHNLSLNLIVHTHHPLLVAGIKPLEGADDFLFKDSLDRRSPTWPQMKRDSKELLP